MLCFSGAAVKSCGYLFFLLFRFELYVVLLFKQPRIINEDVSFILVLGGLVLTRRELFSALQFLLLTGTYHWYQSKVSMGTNKERIEQLEAGLGGVQEGLHRIELGMADRLLHVEETLNRLSDVLLAIQENPIHINHYREGNEGGRVVVSSKTAKLEFPRFSGDDPTEWFNRVNQFFEF